jgi:hypothetical protein
MFHRVSNYRDIKNVDAWREICNVRSMEWEFLDLIDVEGMDTDSSDTRTIDVVNCRQCGILLPLSMASIDHQAPQTTGITKAMCRFFRSVGCTVGSGKGTKSITLQYKYASQIGAYDSPSTGNREERYTLNEIGRMYYTMMHLSGQLDLCKMLSGTDAAAASPVKMVLVRLRPHNRSPRWLYLNSRRSSSKRCLCSITTCFMPGCAGFRIRLSSLGQTTDGTRIASRLPPSSHRLARSTVEAGS